MELPEQFQQIKVIVCETKKLFYDTFDNNFPCNVRKSAELKSTEWLNMDNPCLSYTVSWNEMRCMSDFSNQVSKIQIS